MNSQSESLINLYLNEHIKIARSFPVSETIKLIEAVRNTYIQDTTIYIFGNGGGADTADHFASDLAIHPFVSEDKHSPAEMKRLRVQCLTASPGLLTRLANDMGFQTTFTEQLKSCVLREKDLVIALSTSGNSPNIVNAFEYAKEKKAITALIGGRDGGQAKAFADICILIPGHSEFPGQVGANDNCFHIEDFQSSIAHMVTGILKEEIS